MLSAFSFLLFMSIFPQIFVFPNIPITERGKPQENFTAKVRMPHHPRDHARSLEVLCCCCGRKPPRDGNLRPVKEEWETAIGKFVAGYSLRSNLFPKSICSTCRQHLTPLFKDQTAVVEPPVIIDWSDILPRSSRSSGKTVNTSPGEVCPCGICDIARLTMADFIKWHKAHSRPAGWPPNPPAVKNVIKKCGDCHSDVGPGKPHSCNKTGKRANLTGIVRSTSTNTQSTVVSNTLKTIAVDQGASARGGEVSLQTGGPNKLLVKIGRGRNDKRGEKMITHQDLMNLQSKVGCSDKKLKDINQFLASVLGQKKLEPYLKDALVARNRQLKDFFKLSTMTFNQGPKGKLVEVKRPVISADIPALVTFLIDHRGLDPDNHVLQIGLDGGQSILKVCLLVRDSVGEELGKFLSFSI